MDNIQLQDKHFALYIEEERLQKRVVELAQQIGKDYADRKPPSHRSTQRFVLFCCGYPPKCRYRG